MSRCVICMSLKSDECMDALKECDEKQFYARIYSPFFIGLEKMSEYMPYPVPSIPTAYMLK